MKKIVKGNDFTLKIPVMKSVEGQKVPFPLPACTDVQVRVCNQFKRISLSYEVDVENDNVILARVEGDQIPLGTYAIEVKGKIFDNDWRSNEYPQFAIVAKNADADTEFGETDEGDNSVEMDTALVILPPSVDLQNLITKAEEAIADTKKAIEDVKDASSSIDGSEAERVKAEKERVGEEGVRIESEKKRVGAEQSRVDAEGKRVLAEEARVLAEKKRESDFSNAKSECETATDNANTAADATNKAIRAAETVDATLTEGNVFEVTDRTGAKKTLDLNITAEGSVDNVVGTPSVEITQSVENNKQKLYFNFKNIKGEKGDIGDKGEAFTYDDFTPEQLKILQDKVVESSKEVAMVEVNKYTDLVKLPNIEVPVSGDTVTLEPNKVYNVAMGESLTLALTPPTDTTITNEYQGSFDTGATAPTVTFPADVIWAETPSVEANTHYEFNIRYIGGKYYGLVQEWNINT